MYSKKELVKYTAAYIIGDGGVYVGSNGEINARFQTVKTERNLDFLEWVRGIINNITSTTLTRFDGEYHTINGKLTYTKPHYRLVSKCHPFFTKFRNRMYLNGRKVIDPHYLKLMDWEMLAIIYMDDGTISKGDYNYNLELCTQSFSYGDNLLLKKSIKEKLDIEFNIRSRNLSSGIKYSLYLRQRDMYKFLSNVEEFILPSFSYKIKEPLEFYKVRKTASDNNSDDEIV